MGNILDFIRLIAGNYPAFWPALLFPILLPVFLTFSRWPSFGVFAGRHRSSGLMWGGIACAALFLGTGMMYLCSAAFWDVYESREVSLAALFSHGGRVYPDLTSQERYAAPYGPGLYLALALSHGLFGTTTFASKLPGVAAAFLAVAVFWEIARRQCQSVRAAWSLTGLETALLLAFRQQVFWSKADSLILLLLTLALGAALGRAGHWRFWFGLCLGLACDLKLHAPVYFLPALLAAYETGWRWRSFLYAGLIAAATVALPFLLFPRQFEVGNLFAFLRITAGEGFGFTATFGYLRWTLLLTAFVALSDRLVRHAREPLPGERSRHWRFRLALAVAVALVAVPGCTVGAGQGHLIPLIPVFLLAAGDRFFRGATARWGGSPNVFWRTAVYAALTACGFVAVQTTWRMWDFRRRTEEPARACQAEIRRILERYPDRTILVGSGGDDNTFPLGFRQLAVFAGHPIGLDTAAIMDSYQGHLPEPSVDGLAAELRARCPWPLLWLIPHDSVPFTQTNLYNPAQLVYSGQFRHAFLTRYRREKTGTCYDLYFPRDAAP